MVIHICFSDFNLNLNTNKIASSQFYTNPLYYKNGILQKKKNKRYELGDFLVYKNDTDILIVLISLKSVYDYRDVDMFATKRLMDMVITSFSNTNDHIIIYVTNSYNLIDGKISLGLLVHDRNLIFDNSIPNYNISFI